MNQAATKLVQSAKVTRNLVSASVVRRCILVDQASKIQTASLHQSAILKFASAPASRPRRRRRGGGGSVETPGSSIAEDDTSRPAAVKDLSKFIPASEVFLEKIEQALKPMEHANEVFIVKRNPGMLTIELAPGLGNYTLEVSESEACLYMQSPISGKFSYILCGRTGKWVSSADGHALEGMLVRDLIRQCNGLPDL
mmetsp:Transcript_13032/g.18452  ORF Transcript_13032/g.18452 Transcript_13032/m.18452 type:complete len:197 (+) Transcript_13032:143-733(+)